MTYGMMHIVLEKLIFDVNKSWHCDLHSGLFEVLVPQAPEFCVVL